jgi:hypothetical protein
MQHETKKMFRVVLLFALCFTVTSKIFACDLCGCFIGVLPYDNQSAFGISHRYRIFSGYPNYYSGSIFPQGAYRLSNPPSVLHGINSNNPKSKDDFESYKVIELRGKWFVHPRLELNFILPFSENREHSDGISQRVDGIGDLSIFAGFHLIRKTAESEFHHRLVAGFGIKIPTGNNSSVDSGGERLSVLIQTGTGSTDGLAYLSYTGGGHNFRWGATVSGKINGTNKYHEQLSPSSSNTGFFGYLLSISEWKILSEVSIFHEFTKGLWISNTLVNGTAMTCVMVGPGLTVYHKNISLDIGFQMPVYQLEESYNLLDKGKISIGLTWAFNQKNYLFNSSKKS